MIVKNVSQQKETGHMHEVAYGDMETVRLILAEDQAGFSVSEVSVTQPMDVVLQYKNHIEANIFLAGGGTVENLATGEIHEVHAGVTYVVFPDDRHRVKLSPGTRLICVFNPPLKGDENHNETGGYD
ncbi:MAG: ectoine synthase [Pseudomonadota bacterium]